MSTVTVSDVVMAKLSCKDKIEIQISQTWQLNRRSMSYC